MAKIKHAINFIAALKIQGTLISDQDLLGDHVVSYFKELFTNPNSTNPDQELINSYIPKLINEEINNILTRTPSILEFKNDVFSLNKEGTLCQMAFYMFFNCFLIQTFYMFLFIK